MCSRHAGAQCPRWSAPLDDDGGTSEGKDAAVVDVRSYVHAKDLQKRWSSLWSKDEYAAATCALCGRSRREVQRHIEGVGGYVCGDCTITCVGIDDRGPREVAFAALSSVVSAAPIMAPYREVEPILDAMIGLAQTPAHLQQVFVDASNRGHFELGLRALMAIEASKRTESTWHNIAAMCLNLERLDGARAALDVALALAPGDLHGDCHAAMLAALERKFLSGANVVELVARARTGGDEALLREALEIHARHLFARGETGAALAAIDEALATKQNASLLRLRGDLLAETNLGAAREAWTASLAATHPDGVDAERARARLEAKSPYR